MRFVVTQEGKTPVNYTVKFDKTEKPQNKASSCCCKTALLIGLVGVVLIAIGLVVGFLVKNCFENPANNLYVFVLSGVFLFLILFLLIALKMFTSCLKHSKKLELAEKSLDKIIESIPNLENKKSLKSIFENYFSMLSDL